MSDSRILRLSQAAVDEHNLACGDPATCEYRAILVGHRDRAAEASEPTGPACQVCGSHGHKSADC